jgi:hypothetical protein
MGPHPVRRLGATLRRWYRAAGTLDVRGLAAFRIAVGLILVADSLLRTRDFHLVFAADGIFPPDLMRAFHGDPARWSLALATDSSWSGAAVLAVEGLAGAALAAGCLTRPATIIGWAALVSVIRRTAPATNAGDLWLACLLFWSIFLPLGAAWSCDARRRSRMAVMPPAPTGARSVATVALVLQLAFVYLGAGLAKCNAAWFSGAAMAHVLSIHDHGNRLGMLVGGIDWIARPLTWVVVTMELVVPVVLLVWPTNRLRGALAAAFLMFHAAIWLTMSVGLFAAIGMAAWLPLLPGQVWDRLTARPAAVRIARLGSAASLACGGALVVALASFLHYWGAFGRGPLPRPVALAIAGCCLDQEWSMFGAVPPQEQWVYGKAELADGRVVDLLRGGRPLERERPSGGFISLANHRWHKYFWILPLPRIRVFGPPTAAALVRDWNSRHSAAEQVRSLEIRFAVQGVGATDAPQQDMLVAAWPPRGPDGEGNLDRLVRESASGLPAQRPRP